MGRKADRKRNYRRERKKGGGSEWAAEREMEMREMMKRKEYKK